MDNLTIVRIFQVISATIAIYYLVGLSVRRNYRVFTFPLIAFMAHILVFAVVYTMIDPDAMIIVYQSWSVFIRLQATVTIAVLAFIARRRAIYDRRN
jgi:hypothetical protein